MTHTPRTQTPGTIYMPGTGPRQAVYNDQCSWCQAHTQHAPNEHNSSIATYMRVFQQKG